MVQSQIWSFPQQSCQFLAKTNNKNVHRYEERPFYINSHTLGVFGGVSAQSRVQCVAMLGKLWRGGWFLCWGVKGGGVDLVVGMAVRLQLSTHQIPPTLPPCLNPPP